MAQTERSSFKLHSLAQMRWTAAKYVNGTTGYILTYTRYVCGSVTDNSTWVCIGYRIYSLWRFIAANITITDSWHNNSQLIQTEWSHSTYYCNSPKHWLPPSVIHCEHCTLLIPKTHWFRRLTGDDYLTHWRRLTNSFRCQRLTN
jgi:hypothetical protein